MMADSISRIVESLSPEEQEAVREFVHFLKGKREAPSSLFLAAVDEFIRDHPELLERLAR